MDIVSILKNWYRHYVWVGRRHSSELGIVGTYAIDHEY